MIGIHAEWEKRNMGVNCWEIEIENDDTIENLRKGLSKYETDYTVAKVPVCRMDINRLLCGLGYTFVETLIKFRRKLEIPVLNSIEKKLYDKISYEAMAMEDIPKCMQEIDSGIFMTDRVCIDPYFSAQQAHDRYKGWILQEAKQNTQIYKIMYRDEEIGFSMLRKPEEKICKYLLSGLYQKYTGKGLGIYPHFCMFQESEKLGAGEIEGGVSTNNQPALNIHTNLGYRVYKIYYVFVKHGIID